MLSQLSWIEPTVSTRKVGGSNPSESAKYMFTEKEAQEALKSARLLSKATRAAIKDPTKLCDCCMNEWTWNTLEEFKLCDECYKEKYGKTEVG